MCNKMVKNFNKFVEDFQSVDRILSIVSGQCGTSVFRPSEGAIQGITSITPGQLCPSTHKVVFHVGPRRSDREMVLVEMTADEYNSTIYSRMTVNPTSQSRAMAWRNYLIDNGLLPRLLALAKKYHQQGNLHPTHLEQLQKAIRRFVPDTHERIAA